MIDFAQFVGKEYLTELSNKLKLFTFEQEQSLYTARLQYFIQFKDVKEDKNIAIPASKLAAVFYNLLLIHIPQTYAYEDIERGKLVIVFKELNIPHDAINSFKNAFEKMVAGYQQQSKIIFKLNSALLHLVSNKIHQDARWFFNYADKECYYFSLQLPQKLTLSKQKIIINGFSRLINALNQSKKTHQAALTVENLSAEADDIEQAGDRYLIIKLNKDLIGTFSGKNLEDYLQENASSKNKTSPVYVNNEGQPIPRNPLFVPAKERTNISVLVVPGVRHQKHIR